MRANAAPAPVSQLLDEDLHRGRAHALKVLPHGRQRWDEITRLGYVVEPGDGDILRYPAAPVVQRPQHSEGHVVVGDEDGVGIGHLGEQLADGHLTALRHGQRDQQGLGQMPADLDQPAVVGDHLERPENPDLHGPQC